MRAAKIKEHPGFLLMKQTDVQSIPPCFLTSVGAERGSISGTDKLHDIIMTV